MSQALTKRPSGAPLYDSDLHGWAIEQAAALRAGRISELDFANLAQEIDEVGNEQFSKLQSSFRIILLHLLKWDHQPERRTRSWTTSIAVQRLDVEDLLAKNPSLRRRQAEAIEGAYRRARIEASGETDLPRSRFPAACPYSLDEILTRAVEWPET